MRIGLDIGGTKTAGVVLSEDGRVLGAYSTPTGYGPDEVISSAASTTEELVRRVGINPFDLESIGIGIPGLVDPVTGTVSHAVNLGLSSLGLGQRLSTTFDVPVHVENDVNVAALGAFRLLDSPRMGSMAYLNLGTGLAAGLIMRGEIWQGASGTAGEIGHIPVDPRGEVCACGQRGCIETVASGSALSRRWPTAHPRPIEDLYASAQSGIQRALVTWGEFTQSIAVAVRVLILSTDVDRVVLGGGVTGSGAPLLPAVKNVLSHWADSSPFLSSLGLAERVHLLPRGAEPATLGAALLGSRQ